MTVLKKISVINETKSFKYSILIGNNFIQTLEKNFSKTLKGKKIYVIYDEFFHKLQLHKNLDNLKIFPINVGQDNLKKSLKFFEDLEINNLKVYFDSPTTLAKKFGLRGIPTSILINKEGFEFARIIGSTDFEDKKFIDWLKNYN